MALALYDLHITICNYDGLPPETAAHVAKGVGGKIRSANPYFAIILTSCANMDHVAFLCRVLRRLQKGEPKFIIDELDLWQHGSGGIYLGTMLQRDRGLLGGNRVIREPKPF